MRRQHAVAVAMLMVMHPLSAVADSWVNEYPVAAEAMNSACKANRLKECDVALKRLQELLLDRPDIRCRMGVVAAKQGDKTRALRELRICARSGLEYERLTTEPAVLALSPLPGFAEVQADYQRQRQPVDDHALRFSLGDSALLAEDIGADPTDGSLLVSSVHLRKIIRVDAAGTRADFVTSSQIPMWGVFALAVDARRNVLWATTTAVPQSPPFAKEDDGHSAVLRIGLRSAALMKRYELADGQPHEFGDLTLGDDGTVYAADGRGGGVYAIHPDVDGGLQSLVAPGIFASPQTPALAIRRGELLVPDYTRGIAVVNLARHTVSWLKHPPELSLAGIDGLYLKGSTLVAIQNGTVPERIIVMSLDSGLSRILTWRVAEARVPGLGDPTHGYFEGDSFVVLVNSGWDRVAEDGKFTNAAQAAPAQVWQIPVPELTVAPHP